MQRYTDKKEPGTLEGGEGGGKSVVEEGQGQQLGGAHSYYFLPSGMARFRMAQDVSVLFTLVFPDLE